MTRRLIHSRVLSAFQYQAVFTDIILQQDLVELKSVVPLDRRSLHSTYSDNGHHDSGHDSSHGSDHDSSHGSDHDSHDSHYSPNVFVLGDYFDYDTFIYLLSIVGGCALVSSQGPSLSPPSQEGMEQARRIDPFAVSDSWDERP